MPELDYREVPGFPGYTVSSLGEIICRIKRGPGFTLTPVGRTLRQFSSKGRRRLRVTMYTNGVKHQLFTHHVVLFSFYGPRPDGTECCHWNGDEANNALVNLRWGTRSENEADKSRHGTNYRPKGSLNPGAKLTPRKVKAIVRLLAKRLMTQREIAEKFGITQASVSRINTQKTWSGL